MFQFKRFKERLEIALAESPAAMALDDLEKGRRPILDRARKDLQQIALIITIDQDAEFPDRVERLLNLADPLWQHLIIGVWNPQKLYAASLQFAYCPDDVAG